MDEKPKRFFTRKRTLSLLTVIVMIINMFSPYGVLNNTLQAAESSSDEPYFILKIPPIDDINEVPNPEDWQYEETWKYYYEFDQERVDTPQESTIHVVTMQLIIRGGKNVNTGEIQFKFNKEKLIPACEIEKRVNAKKQKFMEEAEELEDFIKLHWGTKLQATKYDLDTSTIRIDGSSSSTLDPNGFIAAEITFMLGEGVELKDITTKDIELVPGTALSKGLEIQYYPNNIVDQVIVEGEKYLKFEGFANPENEKNVKSVTVKSEMTKQGYYVGEDLDLEGATIEIEYDNGDKEIKTVKDAIKEGLIELDRTTAKTDDDSKVKGKAGDVEFELDYKVVTSIDVKKQPDDTKYKHGETIDFDGGTLELTYDDGSTADLDIEQGITDGVLTPDKTTADVTDQKVKIKCKGVTIEAEINLTVYDPIDTIQFNPPADTDYNHNDTINPAGLSVTITRKSGVTETVDYPNSKITLDTNTKANIDICYDKYDNTVTGGKAGKQDINVTYTEQDEDGNDVTEQGTFTIIVNDTINSIKVTKQPTAKNKWGTVLNALDLTVEDPNSENSKAAELTITMASGHTETVSITPGMLNPSDYNANTLTEQKITVNYNGLQTQNDADKLKLTLSDYVKDITITANNLFKYYGEELTLADLTDPSNPVTYMENYAGGTTSTGPHSITSLEMVTGYRATPNASEFNSSHECVENLTLKVTAQDDFGDEVTGNFNITIKDVITGIIVSEKPTKTVYGYGDAFNEAGGRIKFYYASKAVDTSIGISMANNNITIAEVSGKVLDKTKMEPQVSQGYTFNEQGRATITLKVTYKVDENTSYDGKDADTHDATFTIIVRDALDSIEIVGTKQTEFEHGDIFTLGENATLKAKYKSGRTKDIDIEDATVIDTSTSGELNMSPNAGDYTDNKLKKNVKIQYEENGVTVTSDPYNITIENTIKEIQWGTKPQTQYSVKDEAWVLNNADIIVIRKAGGPGETVPLTTDMLPPLSSLTDRAGDGKTVTVTYKDPAHKDEDGYEYTLTFEIDVKDTVKEIIIEKDESTLKTKYNHADQLDFSGIKIYIKYASTPADEKGTEVTVDSSMVKDMTDKPVEGEAPTTSLEAGKYDTGTNIATRHLKVSYSKEGQSKDLTFDIDVYNIAESMAIDESNPPKKSYEVREDTSNPQGKVKITRKAGNVETKNISDLTVEGLDTTTPENGKTATVKYKEKDAYGQDVEVSATYQYDVTDDLKSVKIEEDPTNTQYNWGDTLSLDGLVFKNVYASQEVTVSLDTIKNKVQIKEVKGPGAEADLNTQLKPTADEFGNDYTIQKTIKVIYTDDTATQVTTATKTFTITIKDNMESIKMGTKPDKLKYNVKESDWDLTAKNDGDDQIADIIVTYQSGRTKVVPITTNMLPTLSDLTATAENGSEQKTVTVTYKNEAGEPFKDKDGNPLNTVEFTITVVNGVSKVTINTDNFENTEYAKFNYAETLDLSKITIDVEYADKTVQHPNISLAELKDITGDENETATTSLPVSAFDPGTHIARRTIQITYTADEQHTATAIVHIEVHDIVTKIEIDTDYPPQDSYSVGANADNPGGKIKIFRSANPSAYESKDITQEMLVSPLDTTTAEIGKTATVKYESTDAHGADNTKTVDYTYNVIDTLNGVEITGSAKTQYNWGDKLDLTGLVFTNKFASANQDITNINKVKQYLTVELDSSNIAVDGELKPNKEEFASEDTITKHVKVTYSFNGQSDTEEYDIYITDNMESIDMATKPDKLTYKVKETTWDLYAENGEHKKAEIKVTYQSGRTKLVDIETTMLSPELSVLTASEGTDKVVTVTYEHDKDNKPLTTEFKINVVNEIKDVEITGEMGKTDYEYGDDIDLGGLNLKTEHDSGDSTETPLDKDDVTIVEVVEGPDGQKEEKPFNPTPSAEDFGDSDTIKKKVKVKYKSKDGKQEAETEEIEITITDVKVEIEMNKEPDDKIYNVNETNYKYAATKENTGIKGKADIKITYESGNILYKALEDEDVILTDLSTLTKLPTGEKTVEVKYGQNREGKELKTSFTITVVDEVQSIVIDGDLLYTEYNYGEELKYDGITIHVKYASDEDPEGRLVDISNAIIKDITKGETDAPNATTRLDATEFSSTDHKSQRTLKITYTEGGKTTSKVCTAITVLNTLDHIEIKESPKNKYQLNDPTNNAGGKIDIYRSAAPQTVDETKNILDAWISQDELYTNEVGTRQATVTYTEEDIHGKDISDSKKYSYTVSDTVKKIEFDPEPTKKTYRYGDPLDLTDGYLKVTKSNDEEIHVKITDGMVSGFNSELGPDVEYPFEQTLTVTYGELENGQPATLTYKITIEDYVKDIELTPPDKTEYTYGVQELDLTGGEVYAVMASGKTTTPVALNDLTVTIPSGQFDPELIGVQQEIKVTYEGFTKSFFVKITDGITSIRIVDYPKQNYKYGESLDVSGGTIEVTRESGNTETIPMTPSMVKGYNPNQLGEQPLTVTYEGLTTSYNVVVEDYVAKIEITKPNKLVYNVGESPIDLAGGKVTVVMASGIKLTPIDMTIDMISGFNTSTVGAKTITVTYEGKTATFSITVVDELSSVRIKTLPDKLEYLYGEDLDLTGGTLIVTRESGATEIIPMDKSMVSGYNPHKLGKQTITVTYEGVTNEFVVEVKDYVSKLIITPPDKTRYEYGEDINLAGGYVTIVMASGAVEEKVAMTASMISGYNSTKEGTQTIQVEYKDLQGSFQVTVVDEIKGIEMNTNPNKTDYKYGQNLDVTGATIKVHKSSGTYIVTVTDDMVSGYNSRQSGTQSITVTYAGFTTNFVVTVAKKATTPAKPSKPSVQEPEVQEPTVQEPTVQEPEVQEPEVQEPVVQEPTVQEPQKPTEVLGVQDENNGDSGKILAGCICILGLLFLLILIVFKRNVKVYVFEDGEFVLGGRDKITKRNPSLDIDKFLDGDTYPNPVKIVLSDSISEKLDGKVIEIKHRGKTIKHTVKYNDEDYEFILD